MIILKIRIRRASDNAEQTFDFSDPDHERQLAEFSKGGDCYLAPSAIIDQGYYSVCSNQKKMEITEL